MAALLCESFGKIFNNCGSCMVVPCKACSQLCSQVVCSPFFPYLGVTAALNLPCVAWGLKALQDPGCGSSPWLTVNGILCLIHIAASFYIVKKIQAVEEEQEMIQAQVMGGDAEAAKTSDYGTSDYKDLGNSAPAATQAYAMNDRGDGTRGHASSVKRMSHVLCYDPAVAVYILIACGWLIWQFVGMSHLGGDQDDVDCNSTPVIGSMACGMLFGMLACCALGCSLICLQ